MPEDQRVIQELKVKKRSAAKQSRQKKEELEKASDEYVEARKKEAAYTDAINKLSK